MALKINKLEIENVKRIKAVKVEPKADGLTIIGGAWRRTIQTVTGNKGRLCDSAKSTSGNEQWSDRGTQGEEQYLESNGSKRTESRSATFE